MLKKISDANSSFLNHLIGFNNLEKPSLDLNIYFSKSENVAEKIKKQSFNLRHFPLSHKSLPVTEVKWHNYWQIFHGTKSCTVHPQSLSILIFCLPPSIIAGHHLVLQLMNQFFSFIPHNGAKPFLIRHEGNH